MHYKKNTMKFINISKLLFVLIIWVSIYLPYFLLAQGLLKEKIKIYTVTDKLPSSRILCLDQDKFGNLWIGTSKGASLFDGKLFKNYGAGEGFTNSEVWAILCEDKGSIWFATEDGLFSFYGQSWKRFSKDNELKKLGTHWLSNSYLLQDERGLIWGGAHLTHRSRTSRTSSATWAALLRSTRLRKLARVRSSRLHRLSGVLCRRPFRALFA